MLVNRLQYHDTVDFVQDSETEDPHYTRVCAIRREGAGETNILRTVEQNDSQIQVRSVARSEKQQCRVLRGDGRRCIQSARGQEDRTVKSIHPNTENWLRKLYDKKLQQ